MVDITPFDGTMPTLHTDKQIEQYIADLDSQHPPIIIEHAIAGDECFFIFWGHPQQDPVSKHWILHLFQLIENQTTATASFFVSTGCMSLRVQRKDSTCAIVARNKNSVSTIDYILNVKLQLSKYFNNQNTDVSSMKPPFARKYKTLDQIIKPKDVCTVIDHICKINRIEKKDFVQLQPTIKDFCFTSHNKIYCSIAAPHGFNVLVQRTLPNQFGTTKKAVVKTRQRRKNKKQSEVTNETKKQQNLSKYLQPNH